MERENTGLDRLIESAWAAQFDDPTQMRPLSQAIIDAAAPASADEAWGWLHRCWAARFERRLNESLQALEKAHALFTEQNDARGLACVQDIELRMRLAKGQDTEADRLTAGLPPEGLRQPWERLVSHYGHFAAADRFSRPDDALRALYRALVAARDTGHAGALANTLSMLGAKHADSGDLEPAKSFCAEALSLAAPSRPGPAWQIAALNLLFVAVEEGHAQEANSLADAVQAEWAHLLPNTLEQAHIYMARARLLGQQAPAARQALQSSADSSPQAMFKSEWMAAHLTCLLAEGQSQRALEEGQAWLASGGEQAQFTTTSQVMQVQRVLARACEALGLASQALQHERAAHAAYEIQMGRSARTRRLSLEIEHELDRERWRREQAQTRQQQAEAEGRRLAELNHALELAMDARTRFLASASHDLRQPVHALALQVAALRAHLSTPAQYDMAARIDRCVAALSTMFDSLLDLSRMDAGVVQPEPASIALAPLLARLVEEQAPTAERKGLRLALRLPRAPHAALERGVASTPATLSDAELLSRALRNLIVNACKFTTSGGVLVSLRPRAGQWWVEIWDTGIGISAADCERVFDEFFQVGNPARDRDQGLGLGLAIVQRLCRLLGHQVRLHSRPGRGTRFVLQLPMGPSSTVGPAPQDAVLDRPLNLHVLVLEDDADVRSAMCTLLEQWGCVVSAAATGTELLALMQRPRTAATPDALLCDLRLPDGRNGLDEVARLRHALAPQLPALLVTGDTSTERLRELATSGLPWLTKPVRVTDIRAWLDKVRQANGR